MIKYYKGCLKDIQWNIRKKRSHKKDGECQYYIDDILTFDIETTSAWINEHGNIIRYHPGRSGDYWNNLKALSLCYLWQFSINDTVYYGRELYDFLNLIHELPEANKIIWVHNLSFEFHFLQNLFNDMRIFARAPHKPMKVTFKNRQDLVFRCTYMLTRLSLDSWGKSLGIPKLTGWLKYNKIRTPITPLTDQELAYGERDCLVVYHGIKDYLKRYKNQWDIPLTQTGTVRRDVKKMLLSDPVYHRKIKKLVPHDAKEYKMLQRIFSGGYSHANRLHAGVVQQGLIEHYDYTSHYPTMLCFKMPMSPWAYLGKRVDFNKLNFDDNAYIFHLKFTRIESIKYNTYIQAMKSGLKNCPYSTSGCDCKWKYHSIDNGRVLRSWELDIWLTEQDWLTIKDCYKWADMEVLGVWKSRKDYLPKAFIEYILKLYGNKTTLKDVAGEEDLYMQSKQYLNSLFGMAVTAILQSEVEFFNNSKDWHIQDLTAEDVNQRLKDLKDWSPRERRYFLSYSWGCWCTAYARRYLWINLLKYDHEVLYADTDSLFILGNCDFSDYNNMITKKLEDCCIHYGIDPELTRPKDPKGRKRQLGVFTKEPDCIEFLTLGAKRYCERREDGKLYLTVSGINKDAVYCLKDDINNFHDGFIFDKDFGSVHKSLITYVYDQPDIIFPDGYYCSYKYGINLRPNGYHLHMTDEYKKLIRYEMLDIEAAPDAFKNHMRGRFTL